MCLVPCMDDSIPGMKDKITSFKVNPQRTDVERGDEGRDKGCIAPRYTSLYAQRHLHHDVEGTA